jgi:hypothetical protein
MIIHLQLRKSRYTPRTTAYTNSLRKGPRESRSVRKDKYLNSLGLPMEAANFVWIPLSTRRVTKHFLASSVPFILFLSCSKCEIHAIPLRSPYNSPRPGKRFTQRGDRFEIVERGMQISSDIFRFSQRGELDSNELN